MAPQLHTPYRFVPLSRWIYMPDWSPLVSHDHPFEDGVSGVLRYTLKNVTPLLVGAEQKAQENQPKTICWARDPHGNPTIPGSSLKGMLRQTLEIASFGKFQHIDENHFSFRDISSGKSEYSKIIRENTVKSAWLKYDEDKKLWQMQPCDHAKIKHKDIDAAYGTSLKNAQSAIEKFKQFPLTKAVQCDFELRKQKQGDRWWAKNVQSGTSEAHLVFTNKRLDNKGKKEDYEFSYAFYFGKNKAKTQSSEAINQLVQKMFDSHGSRDPSERNGDQISYLKTHQHPDFGIPVFALIDKQSGQPKAFGLAKMPRILYANSASELADKQQGTARTSAHIFDLPELLFGTLRDNGMSLKSRVFFSDAKLTDNKGLTISKPVTLGNPKATFTNAYLEQTEKETLSYENSKARLAGWKRYPIQRAFRTNKNDSENISVKTQLELLNEHSSFEGKITFHNLKPEELGALLWCIQLGSDQNAKQRFHSLGHGKSLGAGAVQMQTTIELLRHNNLSAEENLPNDTQTITQRFEQNMASAFNPEDASAWAASTQIKHLLALSDPANLEDELLEYMDLKDFQAVKKAHEKMPATSLNGEPIERHDKTSLSTCESSVFGLGRLSDLCTGDEKTNTWHRARENYRHEHQQKLAQVKEAEIREQAAAAQQEALKDLSECMRKARELEFAMTNASNPQEKSDLIPLINGTLDYFIENECQPDSAKVKHELVVNSDFFKNKNKKKTAQRKEKFSKFKQKYGLVTS